MKIQILSAILMFAAVSASAAPLGDIQSSTADCPSNETAWRAGAASNELGSVINNDIVDKAAKGLRLTDVRMNANGKCVYYYTRPFQSKKTALEVSASQANFRVQWMPCVNTVWFGEELGQLDVINEYDAAMSVGGFHSVATLEPNSKSNQCIAIYARDLSPVKPVARAAQK